MVDNLIFFIAIYTYRTNYYYRKYAIEKRTKSKVTHVYLTINYNAVCYRHFLILDKVEYLPHYLFIYLTLALKYTQVLKCSAKVM